MLFLCFFLFVYSKIMHYICSSKNKTLYDYNNKNEINRLFLLDKPICLSFRQRAIFFSIALFWTIVIWLNDHVYRPYVIENNIDDVHIAYSCPSFFSVISCVFFGYSIEKKQLFSSLGMVLLIEVACLFYEVVMSYTFDYYDVLSTLLGGYPAYLLLVFVLKIMKVYD